MEREAPEKADTATPTGPTHSPKPQRLASLAQKLKGLVWGFLEKKKEKDENSPLVPNFCPQPRHLSHASHLLKFMNLPDEKVPIAPGNFGVCDVDHVLWEKQRQIKAGRWTTAMLAENHDADC